MVTGTFLLPLARPPLDERARSARVATDRELLLEEFLGGPENLLVAAAAQSFDEEEHRFQPLVFTGPSGVGKSMLVRGLAAKWAARHGVVWNERRNANRGELQVSTGADFARAYAAAIEIDGLDDLRQRWRQAKLFVLDGLEELSGRLGAQRELIRLLDEFPLREARVLVASRLAPLPPANLLPGLASRLSGGLLVAVAPPALETRWAILCRLAEERQLAIDRPALRKLAEGLEGPFPRLAGALFQLEAERLAQSQPAISVGDVATFLAQTSDSRTPSLKEIGLAVARAFKVKSADLSGPSRRKGVVLARQIAMYLSRQLTASSLQEVGRQYGGRDHSTVLHACSKAEQLLAADAAAQQAVEEIIEQLKSP